MTSLLRLAAAIIGLINSKNENFYSNITSFMQTRRQESSSYIISGPYRNISVWNKSPQTFFPLGFHVCGSEKKKIGKKLPEVENKGMHVIVLSFEMDLKIWGSFIYFFLNMWRLVTTQWWSVFISIKYIRWYCKNKKSLKWTEFYPPPPQHKKEKEKKLSSLFQEAKLFFVFCLK